jgi:hypothetical protein
MDTESLIIDCEVRGTPFMVVLEDDGTVGYAYLLEHGKIVADVWLYNVGVAPERVDWQDETRLPFQNPAEFCSTRTLRRLTPASRVECACDAGYFVDISIDGERVARLAPGARPGWSRFVDKDGPLARRLI